jgi:hypothetical protein
MTVPLGVIVESGISWPLLSAAMTTVWGKEIRIQAGNGVLVLAGKPVQTAGRADVLAVPARLWPRSYARPWRR